MFIDFGKQLILRVYRYFSYSGTSGDLDEMGKLLVFDLTTALLMQFKKRMSSFTSNKINHLHIAYNRKNKSILKTFMSIYNVLYTGHFRKITLNVSHWSSLDSVQVLSKQM